ncbi:MAG TPA: carboxypeptidase regulatory-like domain-containing protein, partial [Thermoanaerobaculia bacterium]|nr:carboxypeptidase regulatory-like domain-containing protein [Thermoanaerobaculia bacterium]
MAFKRLFLTFAISLFTLLLARGASAQSGGALASGQLAIQGTRLSIAAGDESQILDVAESARVRTCFAGVCGSMAPGDPRVNGLLVKAELSGPELQASATYTATPGGAFLLPGVQTEGTYVLSNIRLVRAAVPDGADEEVLGQATPAVVTLEVRRILATTATVKQLTLAELQARGIQITQQNYDAYSFAVGFAFQGGLVTIDFPVLFQDGGRVDLLSKPEVKLDSLPEGLAAAVRRWQPPHIVPFKLEVGGPPGIFPREEMEELPPETKLFGVIVLPGNVSFLHKYFDAQLLVANGAPAGSGAVLSNVTSTIRLPAAVPRELLRLAGTTPSVAPGQAVPVLGLAGETQLGPGEQGTASFTLEGVAAGTHVVTMEVAADLERPGRDVLPLSGKLKAAIEVVDARFNLAFSHPDVVRADEAYTLFVTVTNVSTRDWENAITLALDAAQATGAVKADPNDTFQRQIETLGPGEGATVEFRLVAKVTGRCVATAFQSSGSVQGVIRLRTGVGEHGIPLSPSSLVLPRFTGELPEPLVAANVPLLGLAYSLAVAPPGAIPPDLPRLVKSDVERRAIDLAEAGQRIFIGEELLPSLEALLLDQLGNRHDRPEFDQLRRTLDKGRTSAEGLASYLRQEQEARNLAASALLEHIADTMSYARPWLAATVESAGSGVAPTLEVRKLNGVTGVTYLAYPAGDPRALRSLAFGETYDILDRPGGTRAPLSVVGRLSAEAGYSVVIHGPISGESMPVTLSFVAPSSSGGGFSHVRFPAFAVPPGQAWVVDVVRAEGDTRPLAFDLRHLATGAPVAGAPVAAVSAVERPPFRLIGARQDFVLDPYGSGVWYLFNRPPAKADAEAADRYEVRTSFRGLDTTSSGTTLERSTVFSAASALLQPASERVVAVRFSQPVSAIRGLHDDQPVITHEHEIDLAGLRDGWGDSLVGPVPDIAIEPDHVGGLVEGKVLRGTGEAVAGAVVRLVRDRVIVMDGGADARVLHDLVAERTTDDSGGFFFPFIEEPILGVPRPAEKGAVQSGFRIQAVVPAGPDPLAPEEREEVTSIIRLQSRLARVNIAMLGRGTITGQVLYEDSSPVPAAAVTAASTLFSEVRSTVSGADGTFRLEAMPVGPITVTARDAAGRSSYATVGLSGPGATADVTLRLQRAEAPRTGTVSGRVLVRRETAAGPVTEPASGASVAVYSAGGPFGVATTGASGAFLFDGVPAGRVTVQAADFSVSRTPALAVTDLAPDTTENVVLTLAVSSPRSVSGEVRYRDPVTQIDGPVIGATVFVEGPGSFALTDETGTYRIDGVPAQGINEAPYTVHAIDFARKLEGRTTVSVTETSPDPVVAATIQIKGTAVGSIDGVVLDPLGQPAAGVTVTLLPIGETTSGADGTFSFEGVPARRYTVAAHRGDGLQPGAIGWIGEATTEVLFGGHRAFATIRLRGAGTVRVRTLTANGPVRTPVSYKPTWFSPMELRIRQKATAIETTSDDNGSLELVVPVGELSVGAASPFYGTVSYQGTIDFAGQVKEVDLVFQPLSTVKGTVVDVDGVTPVAGVTIELRAHGLPPQPKGTGQNGEFEFQLVPRGPLSLTASGIVGTIERTGRTHAMVTGPGQELDVVVRLKAKGTVRGGVVDETAPGVYSPVAWAQFALQENDFPFRRLPASPGYFKADANGRFAVADVTAGRFTVVARHPEQVTRQGRLSGEVNADFEVVEAGNIVLSGMVRDLTVLVRDPETGSPVPDAQVTLSNGEAAVAGADGRASFVALPIRKWDVYAFHAPTGSGGRLDNIDLATAGEALEVVVVLDQKGRVFGTLYDDAGKSTPVGGGTVRLEGTVNGRLWGSRVTALATTSLEAESLGEFAFDGLPVGNYSFTAAVEGSDRRAEGAATLTPTEPEQSLALVLDAVREVYVRVYQKVQAGVLVEVNPDPAQGDGVFAVSYGRGSSALAGSLIASRLLPDRPYPNHHYRFNEVLANKSFWIQVEESSGERRRVLVRSTALSGGEFGAGTAADPYRIVLKARGTVRVTVRDADGVAAASATVRVHAANGSWASAADSDGRAAFTAVEEGVVSVSASIPDSSSGASASRTLEWDDQVLDFDLTLSPVVSAHGVVYEAPENDSWDGDFSKLTPAEGVSVRIQPSAGDAQLLITGSDGAYRFSGLAPGGYTIVAQSLDGSRIVRAAGTLGDDYGEDYLVPPLILDGSRPRILTLSPPNGASSVSRTARVEILFSEPLLPAVLPSGMTSSHFHLTFGETPAAGTWSSSLDDQGRQVVQFTPTPEYESSTTYSLRISGGLSGVQDREGRPLTDSGDIGASFTTSDTVGPRFVRTVPSFARPVDPETPIRIDFGEVLVLTTEQLQAAVLFEWKNTAGAWTVHPVEVSLTRGGYSILVKQPVGVTFTDDSLRRRLTVSGLTDALGNSMLPWSEEYRIYDENPPILSIDPPPNAPSGVLIASVSYTLFPEFAALDDATPENEFGDIDRVEYTFASAADPEQPAPSPGAVLTAAPFAFGFVASYVGNGSDSRPFPVWLKAFDTSGNASAQVRLDMSVLPPRSPVVSGVTVFATAPVAGTTYAGSTLTATAIGLSDDDDARLTISAELRRGTADSSELVTSAPARSVDRPAEGWSALPAQSFTLTLPVTEAEGTAFIVRVRAVDSKGGVGEADAAFVVADDALDPVVTNLVARRPNGDAATSFVIGETFVFEVTVRDGETGVKSLTVANPGGVLPATLAATRVETSDLFRTESVTVPASLTEAIQVEVRATAEDFGGNDAITTLSLDLAPSSDPTDPAIEWLSPFEGGLWPANYSSVDPAKAGVDLLLRFRVTDKDVDGSGNEVPGSVASVRLRGPVDATGALSSDWTSAAMLTQGEGEWIYEGVWRVPNGVAAGTVLRFEAEAVDAGANNTTKYVGVQAIAVRHVYEAATTAVGSGSEIPAPTGTEALPIFLLDGTTLSLYPRSAGGPRSYANLYLYSGGALSAGAGSPVSVRRTTLTSPEVTSYESAVPYYPLELSIGETLAIGHGAAIDVSGRGLLGGDGSHSPVVLSGERASLPGAAGSHGGLGRPPQGDWLQRLEDPGSVYGSVREPRLPGGGGGNRGATGGGVVRIEAPSATVRLHGNLLADGGPVPGGGTVGAAGGSIRLRAGTLEGRGEVRASGSFVAAGLYRPSGSGGRVSLSWVEPTITGITARADGAISSASSGPGSPGIPPLAGAGTVFLERLDSAGQPLDRGTLRTSNPSSTDLPAWTRLPGLGSAVVLGVDATSKELVVSAPAAEGSIEGERIVVTIPALAGGNPTVLVLPVTAQTRTAGSVGSADQSFRLAVAASEPEVAQIASAVSSGTAVTARARLSYAAFEARGAARVVSSDQLEVGGVVDDRTAMSLDPSARILFGGEAPTVSFEGTSPAPGVNVTQGTAIDVRFRVADPLGLSKLEETWLDAGTTATRTFSEPLEAFADPTPTRVTVPVSQPAGPVTYRVRAIDRAGRATESVATWNVVGDATDPVITSIALSPVKTEDVYAAGDKITIKAYATDDVKLARIRISVDGHTIESATSPATLVWLAPPVTTSTAYDVSVVATDLTGNAATGGKVITVTPRIDAVSPIVAIDCPSSGAILPSGYGNFVLRATASDDLGVHRVDAFREGETTPFATAYAASGSVKAFDSSMPAITLPSVSEPTLVRFRVRAVDFGGNVSSEVQTEISVIPAVRITATDSITWSTLVGETVYLESGTLVIDEPVALGGLLVLRGASVTHSAGGTKRLDLTVSGPLFVECGGSIDVTGKGYPARATYSGNVESTDSGGSHLGVGGVSGSAAKALTYGSVERPREAGSGAWGTNPRSGGGVVRIGAGSIVLGGSMASILANGGLGGWEGGAGGSIWITAGTLTGDGLIEAAGNDSAQDGGGGAVAIEYGSVSGTVLTRVNARGGGTGSSAENGGAGTVVLKGPGATYGTLRVDNKGTSGQATVLPSLGSGVAQDGTSGATLVTQLTSIPAYFAGHWVEVRRGESLLGTWRIKTITGGTVTLEPNEAEAIALQAGDGWQGVYRFDRVEVAGNAVVQSGDPIRTPTVELTGPTGTGGNTEAPGPVVADTVVVSGNVLTSGIEAKTLTVKAGARLSSPASTATEVKGLELSISGVLTIEDGGSIDVTGKGYPARATYS